MSKHTTRVSPTTDTQGTSASTALTPPEAAVAETPESPPRLGLLPLRDRRRRLS
jgi:hypothetical protein